MERYLALLLCCLLLLCGCGGPARQPESLPEAPEVEDKTPVAQGAELVCMAETQAEAEEIAALYGITLVSYGNEVAVFTTEEDYREVIRRGKDNGWPLLDGNYIIQLD